MSIGVALAEDGDVTLEALMEAADAALYRAKRRGRDRVERASNAAAGAGGDG